MKRETIRFITSNSGKLKEMQALVPQIEGYVLEIPEIQEIDINVVVEQKLRYAQQQCAGPIVVDDTALFMEYFVGPQGQEGLPGPLIKWFLQTTTNVGLAHMAVVSGKIKARACTVLGYADQFGKIQIFEGSVLGTIVYPQGTSGFGWDHIFVPDGFTETFARMGFERKNELSPRALAVKAFKKCVVGSE
jgi:inosine triphosphate pyrophosphatase